MTTVELIANVLLLGVVLGAAGLGLLAHLCWLAVSDVRELWQVAAMFGRVVTG